MEEILNRIAVFADEAHGDQKRKYEDQRYIVHPMRVMRICQLYDQPLPVLAAAILHDVVEDTNTSPEQIKKFLSTIMNESDARETLNIVIELTDVYTKSRYPGLNRSIRRSKEAERLEKASAEAQTIKYADIIDNAKEIVEHDADFAPVFLKECRHLIKKMKKGNKELREQAVTIVEHELERS
jgi:guanosine-3',5'-bis(diphosphate) 3'-pyrophosphohydrolase